MRLLRRYVLLWIVLLLFKGLDGQILKVDWRTSTEKLLISGKQPRFSWEWSVKDGATDHFKGITGYQVIVGSKNELEKIINSPEMAMVHTVENSGTGLMWNSGKVVSGNLLYAYYNSPRQLQSDHLYYWAVRVWNQAGEPVRWSPLDSFQTALYEREDFEGAKWIGKSQMRESDRILPGDTALKVKGKNGVIKPLPFGTENDSLPLFRRVFELSGQNNNIQRATLYISGLGQFEASINGKKVGDHYLDPGWTNYQKEALYIGFDVSNLLIKGQNAIGVSLGNGFYYVPNKKGWYKKLLVQYGYPKMICRLSIHYKDGSVQNVVSDESWQTGSSPILFSSIYGGELEDGRIQDDNWNKAGFNAAAAGWKSAIAVTDTPLVLNMQQEDPVKVMEKFTPRSAMPVLSNGDNSIVTGWTFDMGQNCSGIPYIEINGKKGDTIILKPAELLQDNHAANQKATGNYKLVYVLGKDGLQKWHPEFTYYGFRYIEVEGAVPKGKQNPNRLPVVEHLETWHIRNSAPEAGQFSCSNDLFNRTNALIKWAMKSNMVSLLTDCPHREKLGWLEQVHLMGSSLRYNFAVLPLLKKALSDMRNAQTPDGLIPEIAPEYTVFTWGGDMFRDSPEWGSSSIIVPWYIYEWYGDSTELIKNYDMMVRYRNYLKGKAKDHILYQGLGDWYDLGPNPPGTSQLTPQGLTATAIYYYDLTILARTASLLGHKEDMDGFVMEAKEVKAAFNKLFLHMKPARSGSITAYYGTGSQTADAMALYMDLVPDTLHDAIVRNLVKGIVKSGYKLTAGDIGYRYLLCVLEKEGYNEIIFKMNNRSDVPGYGYQLAHGATALTESWQALPTVSNNHFMLGHIMEWFYSGILGIRLNLTQASDNDTNLPLVIEPQMVGDLKWAKGSYNSVYGPIQVAWQKSAHHIELKVVIPVGLEAELRLPYHKGAKPAGVGLSQLTVKKIGSDRYFVTKVRSGHHLYSINTK